MTSPLSEYIDKYHEILNNSTLTLNEKLKLIDEYKIKLPDISNGYSDYLLNVGLSNNEDLKKAALFDENNLIFQKNAHDDYIYYHNLQNNGPKYARTKPLYISLYVLGIVIFVIIFWVLFIFIKKSKKSSSTQQNAIPIDYAPVVVTSSTHTPANAGVNYPVDEPVRSYQSSQPPYNTVHTAYPMPQPAPVHTSAPYPTNMTGMPMPQPPGPYPPPQTGYQAPYPPATNPQDVLPPSYEQVVGSTGPPPPTEPYNKQSPYNPHYTGN